MQCPENLYITASLNAGYFFSGALRTGWVRGACLISPGPPAQSFFSGVLTTAFGIPLVNTL